MWSFTNFNWATYGPILVMSMTILDQFPHFQPLDRTQIDTPIPHPHSHPKFDFHPPPHPLHPHHDRKSHTGQLRKHKKAINTSALPSDGHRPRGR